MESPTKERRERPDKKGGCKVRDKMKMKSSEKEIPIRNAPKEMRKES